MYIESMQLSRYSELNSIGARTCYGSDIAYNDCRDKKDGGDYQRAKLDDDSSSV